MTTRTDKSVFTKVLELALCCCSEIPVPAAAKAHDAPTRRPNEAERDLVPEHHAVPVLQPARKARLEELAVHVPGAPRVEGTRLKCL